MCGPTASGKTDFAINLAKKIGGEIINADSRQVYQGLDIGTNKGTITPNGEFAMAGGVELKGYDLENSGITGWLFDVVKPDQQFDLNRFYEITVDLMEQIVALGKTPIICGGTGLYIDALVRGYTLNETKPDNSLRERLNKLSVPELISELQELAPQIYEGLNESDRKNPHRLIRILEKALAGTTKIEKAATPLPGWEFTMFYPEYDREELMAAINNRVPKMIEEGLVAETEAAIKQGYADSEPLNGIGYKEVCMFLKGEIKESELLPLIQTAHRQYAKRQITWFEGAGRAYSLNRVSFK